jgi:phosphoglucomutase
MVASTVSSKMIEQMAQVEGFKFEECLTGLFSRQSVLTRCGMQIGFKFIGNTALRLTSEKYEVNFGYEEAIGYMFGDIRDKDGVAATVGRNICHCKPWST